MSRRSHLFDCVVGNVMQSSSRVCNGCQRWSEKKSRCVLTTPLSQCGSRDHHCESEAALAHPPAAILADYTVHIARMDCSGRIALTVLIARTDPIVLAVPIARTVPITHTVHIARTAPIALIAESITRLPRDAPE